MAELSVAYHVVRRRVSELARALAEDDLAAGVPACPAWTVHDLLGHLSGMADALAAGRGPAGDAQAWIDGIVEAGQGVPVPVLLDRWDACEDAISAVVDGRGEMLLLDLVTHEHDLRGAVGRPGSRGAPEVRAAVPLVLDSLAPRIRAAGLGALAVDSGPVRWSSHVARPGCTLLVDPWEAGRALNGRRTADEIRALPSTGDVEPYLAVFDARLPLPPASLGE